MKHLTLNQRYKIQALLELNFTKSQIARQVGVDKSCITRELQRNCLDENNYDAFIAHKLYTEAKRKAGRITKKFNACIKKEVENDGQQKVYEIYKYDFLLFGYNPDPKIIG